MCGHLCHRPVGSSILCTVHRGPGLSSCRIPGLCHLLCLPAPTFQSLLSGRCHGNRERQALEAKGAPERGPRLWLRRGVLWAQTSKPSVPRAAASPGSAMGRAEGHKENAFSEPSGQGAGRPWGPFILTHQHAAFPYQTRAHKSSRVAGTTAIEILLRALWGSRSGERKLPCFIYTVTF